MTEKEILTIIKNDPWMMDIIKRAHELNLPDWVIGAGFIRNKIRDHIHGFSRPVSDIADIDLVYFDPRGNTQTGYKIPTKEADKALSQQLKNETGVEWEIVNQAYVHLWNNRPPYTSTEDALSHWPETATAIGIRMMRSGELELVAPYGIDDLVNLIVRPSRRFPDGLERIKERATTKKWFEKWPQLRYGEMEN